MQHKVVFNKLEGTYYSCFIFLTFTRLITKGFSINTFIDVFERKIPAYLVLSVKLTTT